MTQIAENVKTFINHNVYILGAGFSYDAGLPMMDNFLHEMRAGIDWLVSKMPEREEEIYSIKKVFTFRRDAASAALRINLNIENIEDLFSLAASSGTYPMADHVSRAIVATLDYAVRKSQPKHLIATVDNPFNVPSHWSKTDDSPTSRNYKIPLYDMYAGIISGKMCTPDENMRNTVITFNYDTVLEHSLERLNIPFSYGLSEHSAIYHDVAKCVSVPTSEALPVLKLHGSMNWAGPTNENGKITVYGSYSDILGTGNHALLIPPTWRKNYLGSSELLVQTVGPIVHFNHLKNFLFNLHRIQDSRFQQIEFCASVHLTL